VRAEDIILQIKSSLPQFNDRFTDDISVTSLTISGNTVTATTAVAHALTVNKFVNIVGAKEPVFFSSLSRNQNISTIRRVREYALVTTEYVHCLKDGDIISITGATQPEFNVTNIRVSIVNDNQFRYYAPGNTNDATGTIILTNKTVAYAVTVDPHDLTKGRLDEQTIIITGSNISDYNGNHSLRGVINENRFAFIVDNTPAPSAGTPRLLQEKDETYNGLQIITSTPTANTFTYNVELAPQNNAEGTIIARTNHRISGGATLPVCLSSYTKQTTNKYWCFVVLDDVAASKSRNISTDATATFNSGNAFLQDLITPFNVYIFAPTVGEIAALKTSDYMHFELARDIFRCVTGIKYSVPFTEPQYALTVIVGHGIAIYDENNGAYLVYNYQFETTERINWFDTAQNPSVALRKVNIKYKFESASSVNEIKNDIILP
jgi:hypothetical protein